MVFVAGACKGLIPMERKGIKHRHSGYANEQEIEEEERRLLFVAMSRPATTLFVTYYDQASPFLSQMLDTLQTNNNNKNSEGEVVVAHVDHVSAYKAAIEDKHNVAALNIRGST